MANLRANKIVGIGSTDAGLTFNGPINLNTQGYMYFPTGDTTDRGRGRGLNGGSSTPANITTIDYFQIQTTGNTIWVFWFTCYCSKFHQSFYKVIISFCYKKLFFIFFDKFIKIYFFLFNI